jgi:transcriptional regulator with GAF, ATPase, and Fis domain
MPYEVAIVSIDKLRELLHADHDLSMEWEAALCDTARQARDAIAATRACIVRPQHGNEWRAHLDSGSCVAGAQLALVASVSVIERAMREGCVRASIAQSDLVRTASVDAQRIHSVVAVALRSFGHREAAEPLGVLYLDRRERERPFDAADEQWARDFAALAERSLSLIAMLDRTRRERDAARLDAREQRALQAGADFDEIQSRDPRFRASIGRLIERVTQADRITVLLQGASGTGKTHLARRIHQTGPRRERPFVVLDCGQAASAEALSAELFGFARKSGFASPVEGRAGKARLADGGVLFIDEINSMPLDLQPRLLRLVESGRFSALGSGEEHQVDVQIIAAANEDLRALVRERRFRDDLYFRLGEIVLALPALSERAADIVPMAERFLSAACRRFGFGSLHFSAEALALLEGFPWARAGSIRGLEHTVHRTVLLLHNACERIERDDLVFPELIGEPGPAPARRIVEAGEGRELSLRDLLVERIARHEGVLARISQDPDVAHAMGVDGRMVPASSLRQRLARLGLLDALDAERSRHDASLDQVVDALRRHGNGRDAANALGISRDQLVWRLRQAGMSIRQARDLPQD